MSVINTNITSMIGQQNLQKSQNALQTSMERLSSGLRINSAKDDAAGQAIANRMSSQITGLAQAQRNANDGISVAQTAEGALNQINDNLQRVRELAVQAENGTNSAEDRQSIQNEIDQRLNEINRISEETNFNGTKVLQSDGDMRIQVGANDGEVISVGLKEINVKTLGLEGFNVTGKGEVANTAASLDSLTLAGAERVGTTNEYELKTDNNLASAANVLASVTTEGSAITVGDATYTVNAEGNFEQSQTFALGSGADAIAAAMTPATAGETVEADVEIGGETTRIAIASDGKITSASSGNTLYLDSTGNLTENAAGSPPAATIDNLSQSLATQAGSTIEFANNTKFETGGIAPAATAITDGDIALDAATLTANLSSAAQSDTAGERAELSVTIDGVETTVFVGSGGDLFANNTDTGRFQIGGSDATASDLAGLVASGGASVTIEAAGGTGDATNVGNTYSANYEVSLSGQEVTAASINDALKGAADGTYSIAVNVENEDGDAVLGTQTINFTVSGGAVTGAEFGAFAVDTGTADDALGASGGAVRLSADDGSLTSELTTDVSYFAQANGNITNDSGQRIFQDADGNFTTDETTAAERSTLGELDNALSEVDALRSDLGAIQNRLESAIENLGTTQTNLSAARSRIEDADYAVEVANMTRAQILQQAGTSVLAQANQIPQNVLSLLG
ncbi:flagellin N-terminal helical domain-containing protein [Vreelandella stevensii]|uniref:flagellin N-terminal helical domain-containing protein n=1 Tax=Vreelandella stevensii TaxID=502821 RepID=UPI0002EEAB27|nr:flagellin [Halomonas stevensii]